MRLFIAVQFHPSIRESLVRCQRDLKAHGLSGNYTAAENLHLTLTFIGEYADPELVLDAMEETRFEPFRIRLSGSGSFRDLFWTGIEENGALTSYVKRLRRALAEKGIPFDRKKFSPHITLIRKVRIGGRPVTGKELAELLQSAALPKGEMTVDHISLMRSDRGRNGMIYTEIGSVS